MFEIFDRVRNSLCSCLPTSMHFDTIELLFITNQSLADFHSVLTRVMYLVSRTENFAKLFFAISVTGLLTYAILAFYSFHIALKTGNQLSSIPVPDLDTNIASNGGIKYILFWTVEKVTVLSDFGEGNFPFLASNCAFTNCYVTRRKDLIGDYARFDAIVMELPSIRNWYPKFMPQRRTRKQKYIFRGIASSALQHVCHVAAENYFNWTWSYKLYSDIFSPFIQVKDHRENFIAPNIEVDWELPSQNENLSQEVAQALQTKSKAIAWIMDRCETQTNRMKFVKALKYNLKSFKRHIDIFGCGHLACPPEGCKKAIKRDYYFYLAYEHSIADDFLTAEVLNAYDNYAIPIVVNGADLTKFLPPGSYIDARDLAADRIAAIIDYMLSSSNAINRYHLWRNYYVIQIFPKYHDFCQLCTMLNNEEIVKAESYYTHLRKWWFPGILSEVCAPKSLNKIEHLLSFVNESIDDYFQNKKTGVKIEV